MNRRDYLLRTLQTLKATTHAAGYKVLADQADQLLDATLDAGVMWEVMVPRVHTLVAEVEDTLSGRRSLPHYPLKEET